MRHSYIVTARFCAVALVCLLIGAVYHQTHKPVKHKMGNAISANFPCTQTVTDPNNCGTCGTMCGTYIRMSSGASGIAFQPGTCANSVCSNGQVADLAVLGCFDLTNASVVAVGKNVCVSLASSPQNCGGLGWQCPDGCQDMTCLGRLTPVPAMSLTGTSPALSTATQTITVSGGVAPYTFLIPTNGSGGTFVSAPPANGSYTPGTTGALASTGVTDVLQVNDSVGNSANLVVTVFAAPVAWMNPTAANVTIGLGKVTQIANSAPNRAANVFTPVTPSATWSGSVLNLSHPGIVFTGTGSQSYQGAMPTSFAGLVTDPANALTIISIQGANSTAAGAIAVETAVTASPPAGYSLSASLGPSTYLAKREADDTSADTLSNIFVGPTVLMETVTSSVLAGGTLTQTITAGSPMTTAETSTAMTGQNIVSIGGWTAAQDTAFTGTANWTGVLGMQIVFNVVLTGNALGYWQGIAKASAGL